MIDYLIATQLPCTIAPLEFAIASEVVLTLIVLLACVRLIITGGK